MSREQALPGALEELTVALLSCESQQAVLEAARAHCARAGVSLQAVLPSEQGVTLWPDATEGVPLPEALRPGPCPALPGTPFALPLQARRWLLLRSQQGTWDEPLLRSLADRVRTALTRAQATALLVRRNEQLQAIQAVATAGPPHDLAALCSQMQTIAAQATRSERCALYLHEPERHELVLPTAPFGYSGELARRYVRMPLDGSLIGETVKALGATAFSAHDTDERYRPAVLAAGFVEFAVVSLHSHGRLSGSLNLSRTTPRPYTPEDLELAKLLAEQISLQIEKARLYEEERTRVRHQTLLVDLARLGAEPTRRPRLLETASEQIRAALAADVVLLQLGEQEPRALVALAHAPGAEARAQAIAEHDQVREALRQASEGPAPLTLTHPLTPPPRAALEFRHLAAARLRAREATVGMACAVRFADGGAFTAAESELLETARAILGVAVEHARLQEAAVRQERLAALGELAAAVAHEVRNPLGVIFNLLTALRRERAQLAPHLHEYLDMLSEEAEQLNRIVGDLLDYTRPYPVELAPGAVEPVVLGAIEVLSRLQPGCEGRIDFKPAASLPPVPMDPHLLRQAMVNLLANAVEATEASGKVSVDAALDPRGGRDVLRLRVSDDGAGMPQATVARLFEPFFTTKAKGTGLGLAIVKRIVETHKGEIDIRSEPGRGTRVHVYLPLSR